MTERATKAAAKAAEESKPIEIVADPSMLSMFGKTPEEQALIAASAVAPKVSVSMARKINLGNYENLDFHFSVAVPLGMDEETAALFNELALEALQEGINIVKPEINERSVKILRQIGRLPEAKADAE